jgi:uncharacterized membrane protein YciS (DUF1049 family)
MRKASSDFIGKAVVLSLILVVISLIGGFAHLQFESWFKWISTIVQVIAIIIFCIQYGKQQTDGVTFGKVFGYGFKVALIVSIIIAVYALISILVIFPEFTDQAIQQARAGLEAKGNLSEDQIDQGMAITKKFLQPVPIAIFAFLGSLFFGTIAALLGGAFAKKSEVDVFQNNP